MLKIFSTSTDLPNANDFVAQQATSRKIFSVLFNRHLKGGITLVTVTNEKELARAMEDKESTIEIVGDLSKKTIKLKATGKVAWAIAFAALTAAVAFAMSGAGAPAALPLAGTTAAFIGGTGATISAIELAVAAGGVAILSALRDDYKIVEKNNNHVVLKRR